MHLQQHPSPRVTPTLSLPVPESTVPPEWEKPKPFYTPMTQPLGTSTTEMWIHRSREQQRQSLEQKAKRTVEVPLPQPTKPKTTTPLAPSPSVTFVPTPLYIPETPKKASSNPHPQLMIVEAPNIFPAMLQAIAQQDLPMI